MVVAPLIWLRGGTVTATPKSSQSGLLLPLWRSSKGVYCFCYPFQSAQRRLLLWVYCNNFSSDSTQRGLLYRFPLLDSSEGFTQSPLRQLWSVAVDCAIYQDDKSSVQRDLHKIWHKFTFPFRHLSIFY